MKMIAVKNSDFHTLVSMVNEHIKADPEHFYVQWFINTFYKDGEGMHYAIIKRVEDLI